VSERWRAGRQILVEEVWNGKLWSLRPVIVVEDRDDLLVVWCPKGTVRKVPVVPPSRPRAPVRSERLMSCLANEDWVLADSEWDVSTLWLTEPDALHSTWVSFLEDGSHWGWYVNLQRPLQRTPRGVQTMDLMLDVIVEPDLSGWHWKDEDEFAAMIAAGLLGAEEAAAVRQEAFDVIARAESRQPPFSDPWPDWRADPAWPLPALRELVPGTNVPGTA
jgi:predicted RNA-binding protein associated with RNAse of E/G family